LQHEAIDDCAVVSSWNENGLEIPKAFVVITAACTVTEQELMDYVNAQVAGYKKVRKLEFINSIPRTASGKIMRRKLVASERKKFKSKL